MKVCGVLYGPTDTRQLVKIEEWLKWNKQGLYTAPAKVVVIDDDGATTKDVENDGKDKTIRRRPRSVTGNVTGRSKTTKKITTSAGNKNKFGTCETGETKTEAVSREGNTISRPQSLNS